MPEGRKLTGPGAARRLLRRQELRHRIAAQQKWIEEHGDSRAGYIARYGSISQRGDGIHNVYGDGGEAIYAADWGELDKLQRELRELEEVDR